MGNPNPLVYLTSVTNGADGRQWKRLTVGGVPPTAAKGRYLPLAQWPGLSKDHSPVTGDILGETRLAIFFRSLDKGGGGNGFEGP